MAQQAARNESTAYNFNRFETAERVAPRPKIKVAPPSARRKMRQQTRTFLQVLGMVSLLAILGSMVIGTYATVGELRREISSQETQLTNEQAIYSDLMFQMESETNLNMVEQRALELGLVKVDKNQVTYIRVMEESQIQLQKSPLAQVLEWFGGLLSGLFEGETA